MIIDNKQLEFINNNSSLLEFSKGIHNKHVFFAPPKTANCSIDGDFKQILGTYFGFREQKFCKLLGV